MVANLHPQTLPTAPWSLRVHLRGNPNWSGYRILCDDVEVHYWFAYDIAAGLVVGFAEESGRPVERLQVHRGKVEVQDATVRRPA